MGQNGFKPNGEAKTIISGMLWEDCLPAEACTPVTHRLIEMCRRKKEQGMDTTQVERFIVEGIIASAEGKALYAEVMLQIAYDSLQ